MSIGGALTTANNSVITAGAAQSQHEAEARLLCVGEAAGHATGNKRGADESADHRDEQVGELGLGEMPMVHDYGGSRADKDHEGGEVCAHAKASSRNSR